MSSNSAKTINGDGLYTVQHRHPLHAFSLNHNQRKSTLIDPRILDEDPEFYEDAEPEEVSALTTGVCHVTEYNIKQLAFTLLFTCDPDSVRPLQSLNLPCAWLPYLHAVRMRSQGAWALRKYYPLPEQQKEWDKWEATHPADVLAKMESFNLSLIPTLSEEEIPPAPLPYLIMAAIAGSPSSKLTEREIKLALIRRFPYFAERLARNSRWQISVNWILSKYRCFEPVPRKPTSEDDGCAYRVLDISSFQLFIYPPRGFDSKRGNPQMVTGCEIPIYPFFPIDYGESISELALKPTRPPRQKRAQFNGIWLSTTTNTVDTNAAVGNNSLMASAPQGSWEINSHETSAEEGPSSHDELTEEISSGNSDVNLDHLMIQPTGSSGEEYMLAPLLEEVHMEVQSLPSLSDQLDSLRRAWPDSVDEPPVAPLPCQDLAGPSLWSQCLLFENIKSGSDRLAKRKLAAGISKQAHELLFGNNQ
ncbi:hypothetical protein Clacol_008467 [Clathrus columnatus]|uniref:Fork-head domain-containing protein n=1 Tax=Clathrus columnatus TaxID=1419009 RepID=A0AAV5AIN0_9AGAM|nr:hypothetical protein Clacol_008467 [Clathrus columnatus]